MQNRDAEKKMRQKREARKDPQKPVTLFLEKTESQNKGD